MRKHIGKCADAHAGQRPKRAMTYRGRKLISLLMAAAVTAAGVSGCAGSADTGATASSQQTEAATTQETTEAAETAEPGGQESKAEESQSGSGESAGGQAKAGTYEATQKGFGGDVTVTVTVDDSGNVTAVEVTADSETPDLGGKAAPKIAQDILDTQSLAVDTVSGATITSEAVLAAAEDALSQAGIDVEAWKNKVVEKAQGEAEEVTVDIVVVGAGGSGTGAALAAAETGAKVMVVEKLGSVGGNSKLASGFFAINSKWQQEENLNLDVDVAVNRLLVFNNYLSNGPLTRAIVEKAADTVEWLDNYGMKFYLQQETTQFAHENDPYEYKCYHKYEDSGAGFEALYEKLDDMGAEVRLNTTFNELIQESDGTVTGIKAAKEDGGVLTVHAKATVLCTGGFGGDGERTATKVKNGYMASIGMPNMGEGYDALVGAGAIDLDGTPLLHACQLAEAETTTVSTSETLAGFSNSSLTQLLMSPLLWVDASGSRFTNEDVVYDTAFWANAAVSAGGRYYFIVDEKTLQSYTDGDTLRISKSGPGACMDPADFVDLADQAVEAGTAWKGSTAAELAEATGMSAQELEDTIARYNSMVKAGKDTDYDKAAASLKFPVEEGDLYAFDCRAVYLGTVGGVKVDEHLQVIDGDYNPIPGLYAAGTNAGGYYNGLGYPPYEGLACGFAWTSGRIAGESAAEYVTR